MAEEKTNIQILRTKLHRPRVPKDHVHRARLVERLEERRYRPLTLVSAPAGYGKSTVVSCWLERCDCPSGWVSLHEQDNDLRLFLTYFVAGVQTMFPHAVSETMALLNAPTLPPLSVLAASLTNELDLIEEDFILVLDDFHCIQDKSVHDLLTELLRQPPRPMHLVIVGRRDPSLPITSLHARGQVTEVRLFDLRFTAQEAAELLEVKLGKQIDEVTAAALAERVEGWVTGLRLAVLAIRGHHDTVGKLLELKGTTAYVMDYLITEVLNAQPPDMRRYLQRTSILDRFCAPLCDVLCGPDSETGVCEIDGNEFIARLLKENLFQISLDTENRWIRYHHLFRHLLKNQLERSSSPEEIANLYSLAIEWFEAEGLPEEALKYALVKGDVEQASRITEENWRTLMNQGRWYVVVKWLSQLPDSAVQERPRLLLAQVMHHYYRMEFAAMPPILDRIDELMGDAAGETHELSGEVELFRGFSSFLANEGGRSLKHLEHALGLIPATNELRGMTELIFGLAGQMEGQRRRVTRRLSEWLNDPSPRHPFRELRLLQTLKFIHYLEGDPEGAEHYLKRAREIGRANRLDIGLAWCDYFEGLFHLQRGEVEAAIQLLEAAGERKYFHYIRAAADGLAAISLAYQANGQPEQAAASMQSLYEFAHHLGPPFPALADSCAARLAIMQGQMKPAICWLESSAPPPAEVMLWWLEIPCVTRCRALIAEGSAESLREAEEKLREYAEMNEAHHNTCQLIGILASLAMTCEKQGKRDQARAALKRALELAQPGGFIFPFLELGPPMAELLKRLPKQNVSVDFIGKLLAAFRGDGQVVISAVSEDRIAPVSPLSGSSPPPPISPSPSLTNPQPWKESLTNRELDILELLSQRLQNKEIAEKLFVSPETVRSHLKNIYQKLQVSNRREAVYKSTDLGILTRR